MNDRVCKYYNDVKSYTHCGEFMCFLCYNWHMKYVHAAQHTYEEVNGQMQEETISFYPPVGSPEPKPGYVDPLAGMSDAQLLQLEEALRLKIAQ